MIAGFYIGVLALFYLVLTYAVILGRIKHRVPLGDGGHTGMMRKIRVHANFAEFVPLALLILFLVDYERYAPVIVHSLGCALVIARILHAQGLWKKTGFSFGRCVGTLLTHAVILIGAGLLIWKFLAMTLIAAA